MTKTALILGASGGFGGAMAEALWNADWRIRQFDRKRGDLMQAAQAADIIVNGWNPPYPQQVAKLPELTRRVIAAAKASGARVVMAGNVYGFGPNSAPRLDERTPRHATNPLGRCRIEMEQAYRDAGVPLLLLRAGDFLSEQAAGHWFDLVIAKSVARGRIVYPGDLDTPHAWAFLPDVARIAVRLLQRGGLPQHLAVPVAGLTMTGRQIAEALGGVVGRRVIAQQMNWWPIRLAAPVWPMGRHLLEMRYLWDMPHRLDGAELERWLPDYQPTALTEVLARTAPVNALVARPDRPIRSRDGSHLPPATPA